MQIEQVEVEGRVNEVNVSIHNNPSIVLSHDWN